jgi:ankyrin repeat protein
MELLCKRGADPFKTTNQNRNSLHQAAESKRPEIMEFILSIPEDEGEWFDINHQDRWGETPLHVAVAGSSKCVKMLLKKGARRDIRDDAGQVPLHDAGLAKGEERYGIVDALSWDRGDHINAQDNDGRPPIFNVLDTPECVALLLSRGALPTLCDNDGRTAIHHACIEDQVESLKLLLGACDTGLATSFDKNRDTPLAKAFESKSTNCIIALLEFDAIGDMEERDGLPLAHRAAQMGNAKVLGAAFNHPTYRKGRRDAQGRTVEQAANDAETCKEEVKDLIHLYESKGIRVDRKGKGRSELAQFQAGPSAAADARMTWAAYR